MAPACTSVAKAALNSRSLAALTSPNPIAAGCGDTEAEKQAARIDISERGRVGASPEGGSWEALAPQLGPFPIWVAGREGWAMAANPWRLEDM